MPESLLSQIELLIFSPVNGYLQESDTWLDYFLLSPDALFRHQFQYHVKVSAVATSAKAVLSFHPIFPVLLCCPQSAPVLSPFSSNPFHCTTLLLPTYSIQASMVIPITSPEEQSVQAFLIYVVVFCFNHFFAGWPTTSCWGVSGGACGSNHHPPLHNKWACWASVPILVNANRKKRKLQTERLRIIYVWITGGKLPHNWMTVVKKRFVSFSGYIKLWCSPVYNTGIQKGYRACSFEILQLLQLCGIWVNVHILNIPGP